jgi:hypothetical protein
VQLYAPRDEGAATVPIELANMREFVMTFTVGFMRLFGVSKLTIKPAAIGIKTIADISFKPLDSNMPEVLTKSRNFLLRNLSDMLVMFGILDIEISPNEAEMKEIRDTWAKLSSVEPRNPGESPNVEEIKLNVDRDPTGEPVIQDEEKKEKPEAEAKSEAKAEATEKAD